MHVPLQYGSRMVTIDRRHGTIVTWQVNPMGWISFCFQWLEW
jgi:hypothetical protein